MRCYNQLNTLHLHLTDAQSFPFASAAFPPLADGAFSPSDDCRSPFNPIPPAKATRRSKTSCAYTPAELKQLVAYAKDRAVRVVPELDTPSHSASWW